MHKTILRSNGFFLALAIMLLGSLFIIASCGGGGGGGGGGVSGITYDGLTTKATVSSTNANTIFSTVWNAGSSSTAASPAKASSAKALNVVGSGSLFKQMTDRVLSDAMGFAARSKALASVEPVNNTVYGSVSGSVTMTGSVDTNTFTGSVTMTYSNFNDGYGWTADGTVWLSVDDFDMTHGIITDATMSFTLWTIQSANCSISLTGSMRVQESFSGNSETMTVNMDGRDNNTGDTFRFENFVETAVYDDIIWPTTGTESINGRVYVRQYGYVDVTTTTPLNYTSFSQDYPNSGGPIILTGENGSKARITPITSNVTIEVDAAPGDGIYEYTATYAWNDLSGAPL